MTQPQEMSFHSMIKRLFSKKYQKMTQPQEMSFDSMINIINDRVSDIEEKNKVIFNHLLFEEMIKLSGPLNSELFNTGNFRLYLQKEFTKEFKKDDNDDNIRDECDNESEYRKRPYLNASYVELDCLGSCDSKNIDTYYNPLCRKYFPDTAEKIIEFSEDDNENNDLRCKRFDIETLFHNDYIYDEVRDRTIQEVIDIDKFGVFCQASENMYILLVNYSKRETVTLQDHISQALRIFHAAGHNKSCMRTLFITPCIPDVAKIAIATERWSSVKEEDKKKIISDSKYYEVYIENHKVFSHKSNKVKSLIKETL